jgi:hypothetical protein
VTTVTNVYGLPQSIVEAVTNDPYVGGGDISTTKLIDSPQVRVLSSRYREQLSVDVSERIWALLGQGVHTVLERAAVRAEGMTAEQRLYAEVGGLVLSGQYDVMHLERGILSDYKLTTVYKLSNTNGWEQQLNVLRWLAHKRGDNITTLEIIAILRDWKKGEAERKSDYPRAPMVVVPITVWDLAEAEEFILDRIALHKAAASGVQVNCTDEERWYTGTSYALVKEGGKRATKVADTREELGEPGPGYVIEERPGTYRRCESYCEVSRFCPQWNGEKHDG